MSNRHLQHTRLVSQAYSLYAGLRYRLGPDAEGHPLLQQAHERYRRRVRDSS